MIFEWFEIYMKIPDFLPWSLSSVTVSASQSQLKLGLSYELYVSESIWEFDISPTYVRLGIRIYSKCNFIIIQHFHDKL